MGCGYRFIDVRHDFGVCLCLTSSCHSTWETRLGFVGHAYGSLETPQFTFSQKVKMTKGVNRISLLSSTVGLAVSFPYWMSLVDQNSLIVAILSYTAHFGVMVEFFRMLVYILRSTIKGCLALLR